MKNNKGVTLVELLIVIVVMGIIAAFAVPSVQTIINNTRKSAVYADALAMEQAAELYCADVECTATQTLDWADLEDYVEGIDDVLYGFDQDDTIVIATLSSGSWLITLEVAANNSGEWEYSHATLAPSETNRDDSVFPDTN